MAFKHLEISFPHFWLKSGDEARNCRAKGPEVLLEAGTVSCSSLHPPALVSQAIPKPCGGGLPKPLLLHLGCSDLCFGILHGLSGSHFPASAEHPTQPCMEMPCSSPLADPSPVCCRPASACRGVHAHPPTLHACSSSSGVSLDTCPFYYFSSRGFPAHACPETCSALLPMQAGLRSGRRPELSVPAEATGLPVWHRVHAWLCGSWCQGFQSADPAGPGHAALQAGLSVQPCEQHGEVSQETELVIVLGTQSARESPRLGPWGQAGQEQAVMVVCMTAWSVGAQGWCA